MRCHLAVNRVTLINDVGDHTHRIDARRDGGLIFATLCAAESTTDPKVVFVCSEQNAFLTLARSYLEEVVAMDDAAIKRYFELGCEVKGLGRGHVKRIKDAVRNEKEQRLMKSRGKPE